MKGHTIKATINQRRPLTPTMRRTLRAIIQTGQLPHASLGQAEQNATRALCDRGLVTWHIETRSYAPTADGHLAALRAD